MEAGRELEERRVDGGEVECLISADRIAARVKELAEVISADYAGKTPLVIGVLKGAWVFMADLVRQMSIPTQCDFVMLSSYGMGTNTSGRVNLHLDIRTSAEGQHILVVEDIVDTGLSMPFLLEHLRSRSPADVRLCALLDKPARRRMPVKIDYVGFTIPDLFVVGYGIDWAERYRELPYVGFVPSSGQPAEQSHQPDSVHGQTPNKEAST